MTILKFLGDFRSQETYCNAGRKYRFSLEPIIRVTAPIIEAQLVETFLLINEFLNTHCYKASRVVHAAKEER